MNSSFLGFPPCALRRARFITLAKVHVACASNCRDLSRKKADACQYYAFVWSGAGSREDPFLFLPLRRISLGRSRPSVKLSYLSLTFLLPFCLCSQSAVLLILFRVVSLCLNFLPLSPFYYHHPPHPRSSEQIGLAPVFSFLQPRRSGVPFYSFPRPS